MLSVVAGVVALYAYFKYLLDWIKGIVTAALHCALEQDTLSDCLHSRKILTGT